MLSASLNKTFLSLSRLHIVPYAGRHQHHMFPQVKARAHTARANRNLLQQHNIRIMPWPALSPDLNPNRTLVGRSATKADNCSRSELCTFSQNMGHDSYDLYQSPYSLHVQEMRVRVLRSWDTHEVLTRNTPTDACDAICTSGTYEETISSLFLLCFSFQE